MKAIVIGAGSDIAKVCCSGLTADGWEIDRYSHTDDNSNSPLGRSYGRWDLLLIASGTLQPVGDFVDLDSSRWERGVYDNLISPLRFFKDASWTANDNAAVCFFSGPNPERASPGYSAYAVAKAGLREAVRTLDAEFAGMRIFLIAPGFTRTKFHAPHVLKRTDAGTDIKDVWRCLQWSLKQSKDYIGGRMIGVFGNEWRKAA